MYICPTRSLLGQTRSSIVQVNHLTVQVRHPIVALRAALGQEHERAARRVEQKAVLHCVRVFKSAHRRHVRQVEQNDDAVHVAASRLGNEQQIVEEKHVLQA